MLKRFCTALRPIAGAAGAGMAVAAIQMVMVVLAARSLGVAQYGIFALALGLANLLAELGTFGFPVLANRTLARYAARRRYGQIAQFVAHGDRVFTLVAIVAVLALGGLWLALRGHRPDLADGTLIAALLLPAVTFRIARRHQLSGLGHPAIAALVETGLAAGAGIVVLLAGGGLGALALGYTGGSVLGVMLAGYVLRRHGTAPVSRAKPDPRLRRAWHRAALPMWLAAGGTALFGRVDLVMLGPLTDTVQIGLYAAAVRLTYLIGIVAQIGLPIFWPLIARETTAPTGSTRSELLYLGTTGGISVIAGAALWLFSAPVTTLIFGAQYSDAVPVLRVLCIAQVSATLVTALTGMLLMRGHGRSYMPVMLGGLGLGVVLNLALIPLWGALGAAWATLATSLAMLGALVISVRARTLREGHV